MECATCCKRKATLHSRRKSGSMYTNIMCRGSNAVATAPPSCALARPRRMLVLALLVFLLATPVPFAVASPTPREGEPTCPTAVRGRFEATLMLEAETLVRTTTTSSALADKEQPPHVIEEPSNLQGSILYLTPHFSVQACSEADGTARYKLGVSVQGCESFSGDPLPASYPDCLATHGCSRSNNSTQCMPDGVGCFKSALESLEATFDVSSEGAVQDNSLLLHVKQTSDGKGNGSAAGKAAHTVHDVIASCPQLAGLGRAAGAGTSETERPPPQQLIAEAASGLQHLFELLALQANQRVEDISEEVPVQAYANLRPGYGASAGADGDPSVSPRTTARSTESGGGRAGGQGGSGGSTDEGHFGRQDQRDPEGEPIEYAFNTETSVGAPAADGSLVVTQQRYLVPTEGAHEAMPGGTVDVPAGGVSQAILSPSGRVVARLESVVSEVPLPTRESQEPMVLPSGAVVTKALVIRNRLIITLSLITPARRRQMAEGAAGATASAAAFVEDGDDEDDAQADSVMGGALQLLAQQAASATRLRPDALYPGGHYPTFIAQWKQQLEDNSRRRRRRLAEEARHQSAHTGRTTMYGSGHATGSRSAGVWDADQHISGASDSLFGNDGASMLGGDNGDADTGNYSISDAQYSHGRKLTQSLRWQKTLFSRGAGVDVESKYTGLHAHVDVAVGVERDGARSVKVGGAVNAQMDAHLFGRAFDNVLELELGAFLGVKRVGPGESYTITSPQRVRRFKVFGWNIWNDRVDSATRKTPNCDAYQDRANGGMYFLDFSRQRRVGSFEVRWKVIIIRVALDVDFSVYSTIGECNFYRRNAVGAGAGMAAGVTGVVSAGFDVWLASLTVNAGITVARPSLTGYALWTSAMAAYARLVEPSCVSLTLSVHGLDIQISYTTSLLWWENTKVFFRTKGWEFLKANTGWQCNWNAIYDADKAALADVYYSPPPPVISSGGRSDGLCAPYFVVHGASYYATSPRWITSDMAWRLRVAGVSGDGSASPLPLPALPEGWPGSWLEPYSERMSCTWIIYAPWDAVVSIRLRYMDIDRNHDLVSVYFEEEDGSNSILYDEYTTVWYDYTEHFFELPKAPRIRILFKADPSSNGPYNGFLIDYTVKRQGGGPPDESNSAGWPPYAVHVYPADGGLSSPPGGDASDGPLCDYDFLTYGAEISGEHGISISSDFRWRLTQMGIAAGEGQATLTQLPAQPLYPEGDPAVWLKPYQAFQSCMWHFKLPPDTVADIVFWHLDLERDYDFLQIWALPRPDAPSTPETAVSQSFTGTLARIDWPLMRMVVKEAESFNIWLTTDGDVERTGFFLTVYIKQAGRGGEPPGDQLAGYNDAPFTPTPTPSARLLPSFAGYFDEGKQQCSQRGLQVHGPSYYTGQFGAFITSNMQQLMESAGITSDGSKRPIALPALPERDPAEWMPVYAPNTTCSWRFELPPGAVATLRFEFLSLEHSYDFLSVIDDKNKGALLARLTGFIASPPVLVVNTTRFSLRLVTDDQVQHQGFIIRYWVDAAPVAVPEQPYWMPGGGAGTGGASTWLCDTWMVVHGANYFQDSTAGGWITSDMRWRLEQAGVTGDGSTDPLPLPSLPANYPTAWLQPYAPDTQCTWVLQLPPGATALLQIEYLDLESGYDFLTITKADGTMVANLTGWEGPGSRNPINVTKADAVHIKFTSDDAIQMFGFWLRYWVYPA